MSEFTPIVNFPNFIYIPKVVPLVYDDVLSYYEFLNKVLVKLNEVIDDVNDLGVDVEELKDNVERLATLVDGFDTRIETLETSVSSINTAIDGINSSLTTINSTLTELASNDVALGNRITALETSVNQTITAAITALETQIGSVSSDVTALEGQFSSMDGRVTALESATFEAPIVSNWNFLQCNDIQHLDNFDYEIKQIEDIGGADNAIQIVSGYIRFLTDASLNPAALVIHNVLPDMPGTYTSSQILSFGLKYRLTGSYSGQNGTDYNVNIPFTSLSGTNPYVANDHYTSSRGSLRVLQLKKRTDGKGYDLWIYNNYQSTYRVGNVLDIYAIGGVFKDFAGESMANIKAYWVNVYGNTGAQVGALIAKKTPAILTAAQDAASHMDDIMHDTIRTEISSAVSGGEDIADENLLYYVNNSSTDFDEDQVEFNEIQGLDSNITVDYSACRFGISEFTGVTSPQTSWTEELRIWINIELTISGASAINTVNSIPVLNISNTKGATISKMIPLTAHAALPAKAPFVEAYLHTNGNIIFRCWFDDTNYDYIQNPITIRIAGYVPLPYTYTEPQT